MFVSAAATSVLRELKLRFATPEAQLSEAIRLWKARDTTGAVKWGRRAARHLHAAKVPLADWLMLDIRGPQAEAEAVALLKSAAEAGYPEAQQVLAAWYLDGTGVPKDPEAAFELTKRAADAGLVACQQAMVRFLTLGEYREPDIDTALHYAQQLADAGHPEILAALLRDLHQEKSGSG